MSIPYASKAHMLHMHYFSNLVIELLVLKQVPKTLIQKKNEKCNFGEYFWGKSLLKHH